MARISFAKIFLSAILFSLALAGNSSTVAGQTSPGGRIIGKVIETGSGRALPAEVGVSVYGGSNITFTHARCSKQGEFEIERLPAGRVHLATKLEGYATEHQNVSVTEGGTQYVNFYLTKVKLVRGVVRGPTGRALTGAHIRVIYPAEPLARGAIASTYQWETGDAQSDLQGNFALDVHPGREFVVEASHPDYLGTVSSPMRLTANEKAASVRLSLSNGTGVSGEVKDEDGRVVQNAQVRLIEQGGRPELKKFTSLELLKQRTMYTATGAGGLFKFEQVKPARKTLIVLHPGYQPFRQEIDLAPGQRELPLRVTLRARK
ncbi:MAG TPA: carboxypeptidase regulatory-like domain-containing protein [Pyrinomonadaceae bacterium]